MIGDFYRDKFTDPNRYPYLQPVTTPIYPFQVTYVPSYTPPSISREEFEALKQEVMDMKELLKRAIKYDEENNEPHSELNEKITVIQKIAELVGVDLIDLKLEGKYDMAAQEKKSTNIGKKTGIGRNGVPLNKHKRRALKRYRRQGKPR